MNKLAIPAILLATVMVAGIFAFSPIEKATSVHTTITATIGEGFRISSGSQDLGTQGGTNTFTLNCTNACIVESIHGWTRKDAISFAAFACVVCSRCEPHFMRPLDDAVRLLDGVTVARLGDDSCRVTFAEKPERSIIDALKAAGFFWNGGSWHGRAAELPEGIA